MFLVVVLYAKSYLFSPKKSQTYYFVSVLNRIMILFLCPHYSNSSSNLFMVISVSYKGLTLTGPVTQAIYLTLQLGSQAVNQ